MFVQKKNLNYTLTLIHVKNRSIFFFHEIEFDTDKRILFNNNSSDAIFCERKAEENKEVEKMKKRKNATYSYFIGHKMLFIIDDH